ncbi:hypothetical protein KDL29_12785 [bacterium]|nr:hypothetical protein [bacterium]
MDFVTLILNLDRKIIFACVAVLVAWPLIWPLSMPVGTTPEVRSIFSAVDALPNGSDIMIAADYDPSSKPELQPFLYSMLAHCFEKDHKVHILTLWPGGPALVQQAVEEVSKQYGKTNGTDWCFLGYKPGNAAVVGGLTNSITGTYPTDFYNRPTANMPIYQRVQSVKDCDYIVDIAAGATVEVWIAFASAPENVPMSAACTAVSAAGYYPYYQAGQLDGISGGMKGSAEYDVLLMENYPNVQGGAPRVAGNAVKGMDAQSAVHLFIVLSIILANICYFIANKRQREERRTA